MRVAGTAPNPTGLTMNNNVYFANGTGAVFGFFNSLDVANLVAWRTAVGQDSASIEGNPQYNDPTNAVPDLHIHPTNPTVVESNGADVGVTDDFDGQTRSGLTPVDIGADAGNFNGIDLAPPIIAYTPLGNTTSTSTRSLGGDDHRRGQRRADRRRRAAAVIYYARATPAPSPRPRRRPPVAGSTTSTRSTIAGGWRQRRDRRHDPVLRRGPGRRGDANVITNPVAGRERFTPTRRRRRHLRRRRKAI